MSDYRRVYIKGGTYFFTLVTHQRKPILLNNNVQILRDTFDYTKQHHPFQLIAISIMPDHLHCIWTLPGDNDNFSKRWQIIKKQFTLRSATEKPIWQPRFWEHLIRDESDLKNHIDYIHYNPVKHGLANSPNNWKHSSFQKYIRHGWYDENWGETLPDNIKTMDFE